VALGGVYVVMLKTAEPIFGDTSSLRLLINAVIDYAIYMIDLDGRIQIPCGSG
jgi:hypothetical protein